MDTIIPKMSDNVLMQYFKIDTKLQALLRHEKIEEKFISWHVPGTG